MSTFSPVSLRSSGLAFAETALQRGSSRSAIRRNILEMGSLNCCLTPSNYDIAGSHAGACAGSSVKLQRAVKVARMSTRCLLLRACVLAMSCITAYSAADASLSIENGMPYQAWEALRRCAFTTHHAAIAVTRPEGSDGVVFKQRSQACYIYRTVQRASAQHPLGTSTHEACSCLVSCSYTCIADVASAVLSHRTARHFRKLLQGRLLHTTQPETGSQTPQFTIKA